MNGSRRVLMSLIICTLFTVFGFGQKAQKKSNAVGDEVNNSAGCTAVVFGSSRRSVERMTCKLFVVGSDSTDEQAAINNARAKLMQEPDLDRILERSEAPYQTTCQLAHGAVVGVPAAADLANFSGPVEDCNVLLYTQFASSKQQAEADAVQYCIDVAVHSMPRGVHYFEKYCRVIKSW